MRESRVERYLHREVEKAGGTTRKHKGRIHDPDRLVIWPNDMHLVETKATGKKPRAGQLREHIRMWQLGHHVHVVDTYEKINEYVKTYGP